jgi:hypothetical protein
MDESGEKKSDARSTIESSILMGLSERAHLTGANITQAGMQSEDILKAMFDDPVVWSVREYLKEIGKYDE